DAHSFLIAAARRDTDQQARAKLDNGMAVFNYGVHFEYRVQKNDFVDFLGAPFTSEGGEFPPGLGLSVPREANLYMPDAWVKYERKLFRVELELAAVLGSIGNHARSGAAIDDPGSQQRLGLTQFGGVAQGEYRFMDGALKAQLELGFASGDRSPGFGNYPRRTSVTRPGDMDGPQYDCSKAADDGSACADSNINNFRFNRDYRVDMILWREIVGGVTDGMYAKPSLTYRVAEGFDIFGAVIYSRAVFANSTPSFLADRGDANLGIELNVGARYETEDGFFASVAWGILFPLGGFVDAIDNPRNAEADTAQALRGSIGIRY
ncbi:MAG: TIGR04551 family protein, partial [Myxococcaceae bacterium]